MKSAIFRSFSHFMENVVISFLVKRFKIMKDDSGHILAKTAYSGKIWFSRNLGKGAKIGLIAPFLKQPYLLNGWSKSKSVLIFEKTKDRIMFCVRFVF